MRSFYTGDVYKQLYILSMNRHKPRVRDEVKDKMYDNFVEACRDVVDKAGAPNA